MKRKGYQGKIKYIFASMIIATAISGCGNAQSYTNINDNEAIALSQGDEIAAAQLGVYDSEDTAIVVKKDYDAKTIQLQNIATSRRYTLNYDGTTTLYDKYDEAISMQQLQEGSIVTARFYKDKKALTYVKEYAECVHYDDLTNYTFDLRKGTFSVGKEIYNISGHVVAVSGGKEIDLMDVNDMDQISVWGSNNMIYGINVEQGHGYLRLQNETYFVGGWVEVGDKVIKKITEDMLIVVPEGTHNVTVSHKGSSATQEITFARNEEMAWDLGEIEIKVVQKGKIIFTLTPATAKLYIDQRQADASKPIELEYGLHQMRIEADGYDSVAQYIKVAEPQATIEVALEKSNDEDSDKESSTESSEKLSEESSAGEDSQSDNKTATSTNKSESKSTSDNDTEKSSEEESKSDGSESEEGEKKSQSVSDVVSTTSNYKVYIDAPDGVEAYIDGNYIGITPISFPKESGNYVVTLRKSGYQTRSYTLQIDDEEKDVNYSFAELVEMGD